MTAENSVVIPSYNIPFSATRGSLWRHERREKALSGHNRDIVRAEPDQTIARRHLEGPRGTADVTSRNAVNLFLHAARDLSLLQRCLWAAGLFVFGVLDQPLGGPPYAFVRGVAAGIVLGRALRIPSAETVSRFSLIQAGRALLRHGPAYASVPRRLA